MRAVTKVRSGVWDLRNTVLGIHMDRFIYSLINPFNV